LIIPYIISCVVPAFFIREWRHAKVHEFIEKHKKKPSTDVMENIEDYEEIQERYARSLRKSLQKPKRKKEKTRTKHRK